MTNTGNDTFPNVHHTKIKQSNFSKMQCDSNHVVYRAGLQGYKAVISLNTWLNTSNKLDVPKTESCVSPLLQLSDAPLEVFSAQEKDKKNCLAFCQTLKMIYGMLSRHIYFYIFVKTMEIA